MTLEIRFWDVQHGNAIYMKTPNGMHIVQDLGLGSFGVGNETFSPLKYLKNKMGVNKLDYVIITHPHKDHIDDILNFDLLNPSTLSRPTSIPKDDVIKNVKEEDKPLFDKYFEINNRFNQPITTDPAEPNNNGGVDIQTFVPTSCSTSSNINNRSIVTVIEYEDVKVILPGDNQSCSWNELLENTNFITAIKDAHVLLAPHHGRESGFKEELFDHFTPKLTIISDTKAIGEDDTKKYREKTDGWNVTYRDGSIKKRYCLTTRNDHDIQLKIGRNSNENNFLEAKLV